MFKISSEMSKFFQIGSFCLGLILFAKLCFGAEKNNIIKLLEINQNPSSIRKSEDVIITNTIQSGERKEQVQKPKPKEPVKEVKMEKAILADFQKWTVLTANPNGKKMCYSVIYSAKRIGNINSKDQNRAYFMVHYFSETKERVSVFFGYELKKGSRIFMSIDGVQFELIPYESYAFSDSAEVDSDIISYLLTAKRLLIRGEGDGNAYSVDEYNVSGFAEAYSRMKKECGGLY